MSRAVREAFDAIDSDSMYRYFRVSASTFGLRFRAFKLSKSVCSMFKLNFEQGGDHTPFFALREKLQMRATFTDAAHRRKIFTVGHGNAVCY